MIPNADSFSILILNQHPLFPVEYNTNGFGLSTIFLYSQTKKREFMVKFICLRDGFYLKKFIERFPYLFRQCNMYLYFFNIDDYLERDRSILLKNINHFSEIKHKIVGIFYSKKGKRKIPKNKIFQKRIIQLQLCGKVSLRKILVSERNNLFEKEIHDKVRMMFYEKWKNDPSLHSLNLEERKNILLS